MIKIAFADFWDGFNPERFPMTGYIREICDIEITDMGHADYLIYSVHGDSHWFAPDSCVKIFYTREDIAPDFNACDYAIGFEWMTYEDRYLRSPLYYRYPDVCQLMEQKHLMPFNKVKDEKTDFCSITVSNANRDPMFKTVFEELSKYKKVDSGGLWRNNIGGQVKDKLSFDQRHKFSIVCENTSHSGYTTEKLVQALAAGCIPIYWGDPHVAKVFNPKSFINVLDFPSVDKAIAFVKCVDNDDELWASMVREPALADEYYSEKQQTKLLKQFLAHIFTTPLEEAYRRNRLMWGRFYIEDRRKQVRSLSFTLQKKYHKLAWQAKQRVRKLMLTTAKR